MARVAAAGRALLLATLGLGCGVSADAPAAAAPSVPTLTAAAAVKLAKRYFAETDAASRAALLDASPDGCPSQADVAAIGRLIVPTSYPAMKAGVSHGHTMTVPSDVSDKPVTYSLSVPSKAPASRFYPLIIGLHGGGENVGDGAEFMQTMSPATSCEAIIVCPTSVDRTAQLYWRSLRNQAMLGLLIQEMGRHFPIDPNRVYLCGYSMGGLGSYFWGLQMSDRFAAVAPGGGAWTGMYWPGMLNTPLYIWHGKKDLRGPMFTDFPFAQTAADIMKELGYACELRAIDCDHEHLPGNEVRLMADWLLKHKREPYPKRVVLANPRVYAPHKAVPDAGPDRWLVIDENGSGEREMQGVELGGAVRKPIPLKMGTLDATWTSPNNLDVKADNVRRFRVLLTPSLMDLAKPLIITVNGKVVHDTPAPTSYRYMLRSIDERRDPGMIFLGEVSVGVE